MAALELATHPEIKLFGLNLLFSLVSVPESAQRIQQLHNFSHFDFNRLAGNNEIFSFEELVERDNQIGRLDSRKIERLNTAPYCQNSEIEALQDEIEALQDEIEVARAEINMFREELDALHHSTSWKITAPLRNTRRLIARLANRPRPLHLARASLKHGTECYQAKLIITPQISRQRIVHVIGNFLTGGSSRLVVDLFEGLGHLYEQEVATQYNPAPRTTPGYPIHEFSGGNAQEKFMDYLRLYRPELIHIHYWEDRHWYGRMINAAREFGCTVIQNINTPTAPYIDDCISRYIYVSNYVKSRFGQRDGCSFTIYPGSNFKLFSRDVSQPMPEDCIGMVYRLDIDKLNKKSIDVFIKVVQKRPQTKAIIIGGGHLPRAL